MFRPFFAAAFAATLIIAPAIAHDTFTVGDIEISGGFTRATLPNAPVGGGYIVITNNGSSDDTLIAASSPVAGEVQLHEMKMEGEVMKMAELPEGIPVPAGATVTLEPGGLHLMLMGLKAPLVEGETVPVTLTFATAGTVEIHLVVGSVNAKEPEHPGDHAAAQPAGHSPGMAVDQAGLSDIDAITHMQKAMFDTPDNPLTIGPIVVVGDYAVSDWAQAGSGGRALLRKTEAGWGIHLCSGDGLKDAANLVQIGVPANVAEQLAHDLAAAEAQVDAALLAQFSMFDGVMMVDEGLI